MKYEYNHVDDQVKKAFIILLIIIVAISCSNGRREKKFKAGLNSNAGNKQFIDYVDPYIGSGGHGHVFVGANVPFGAVQPGPQNIFKGWDWCSGYHYSDSIIIGFSQTHLSGTGCTDLGDVLIMPFQGKIRTRRGEQNNIEGAVSSTYRHSNEKVSPGYYSLLMDNGIMAEMTATERTAIHRFKFPSKDENSILINLKEGNGDKSVQTYLKKVGDYTIQGYRFSKGWAPFHRVFFTLRTEVKIKDLLVFDDDIPANKDSLSATGAKGVLVFENGNNSLQLKVSISSVSAKNADQNLQTEIPDWNFEQVKQRAEAKWNNVLSRVEIETDDSISKTIFYTSLYHASFCPMLYSDVNGEFRGHDDKVYLNNNWKNYSTFSLWDTYRTWSPLSTILFPEYVDDFVNSMLGIYDQQHKLPIWPLCGAETNCMPGYSSVQIIADAYLKGFKGFDAERAFKAMDATANYLKQRGIPEILDNGVIPFEKMPESVSIAMEYAVGDWSIAKMAKKMGKTAEYNKYLKRGKYYERYFDKSTNFIRPVSSNGVFKTPYDPFHSDHGRSDFTEGNGWQYTFMVPQNPDGLIKLFGKESNFTSKLDSFFLAKGNMGDKASVDITGLIGMYAHGNEPSHHIAYLYTYAGQQWKAAEKVRYIQSNFYTDKIDGIIGNEDAGQMSAWYIMSSFGFYQVSPTSDVLVFGSPLFSNVKLHLPNGKTYEIIAENNSSENIYIQSVQLNEQPLNQSFIRYNDVMKGGVLKFVMGNKPNMKFGTELVNRPKTVE